MAAAKGVSTTAAGMSAAAGMATSTAPTTAAMSAATSAVLRKRRPSAGQDQSQRA
jgi:hypothetical protein